jgi:hypothetical protein
MKTSVRLLALCLLGLAASAQATIKGVTDKGDEVLLEDDGTWHYVKVPAEVTAAQVATNDTRFTRARDAAFPVRSTRNDAVVYMNPKQWSFTKAKATGDIEYTFRNTEGDVYAALTTERISAPLEKLGDVILGNVRQAAPDAEVVMKEYRVVNDRKLLYMRMTATIQGMKFVYMGYYFSDDSGTTQLVAWTSRNLAQTNAPRIEAFLNGLTASAPPAAASASTNTAQ